jgi:hypothetical protein
MPETTTPEPLIDPDCDAGKHGSCVGGPCECMCHGPAPVTAEDLTSPAVVGPAYAAVYEVIRKWPGTAERNAVIWRAVTAYRAALAGDPGDLPALMAAVMAQHHDVDVRTDWACVCGVPFEDWNAHLAEVAMSVRWEDHAATIAQLAQALARADHAEKAAVVHRERTVRYRRERDALKARMRQLIERMRHGQDPFGGSQADSADILDAALDGRE